MANTKYLIIGGGVASANAAVAIRERDKEGAIILVDREDHFPYDRPPLSKDFLASDKMTVEDPESKDPAWFTANNVEVRKATEVVALYPSSRCVTLAGGETLAYETLLLTTGASAVHPAISGAELENVFFLRTVDDAAQIRTAIRRGGKAVMVGGGYIGLEVAASAASRGIHCTIIDKAVRPWSSFASEAAGDYVKACFEANGVTFVTDDQAARILGDDKVTGVRTLSGQEIPADFVVIGVGAKLNTSLAMDAGLTLDPRGAVVVNELLESSIKDIYAAGDIAAFPDGHGGHLHLEHYMNASWQGSAVGATMAGEPTPYRKVAYFFSDMFDIHMALRGAVGGELVKTVGQVASGNFLEIYGDTSGLIQMGLVVSTDPSKLDPISDVLEGLIEAKTPVASIDYKVFAAIE